MKGSTASASASTPSHKRAKSQILTEVSRLEQDQNYFVRFPFYSYVMYLYLLDIIEKNDLICQPKAFKEELSIFAEEKTFI